MPTERETAFLLLHAIAVASGEECKEHACLLEGVGTNMYRLETSTTHPCPPLSQRLVTFCPLRSFAGHHVADLPTEVDLRHQLILLCLAGGASAALQRIEHRRIVVKRFSKSLHERTCVVVCFLLYHGHDARPHSANSGEDFFQSPWSA
ncbi:hypothetical protein IEQ34_011057 [Dendrobium chrysotoxum]|uniref:Secreted protein n=1 Tax=Dendrobium chrysotoxum TaxID=161865 RepID=A0AAV7GF63_DENCH|nr:hypothetical protein IEQ34_011057 [Dendrobium chrysotoxum]